MDYQPIEDYGLIGDMHTAALVGSNGSVDWLCWPRFDSPSVFAALLDVEKGGFFRIWPRDGEPRHKQSYWPDTNVLVTRFFTDHGTVELTDFMPLRDSGEPHGHQLIRRITVQRGRVALRMECRPAFNYARDRHEVMLTTSGAVFRAPSLDLGLSSTVDLRVEDGAVVADFELDECASAVFALGQLHEDGGADRQMQAAEAEDLFRATVGYWRQWLSRCSYQGRWREMVYRSALALKLLTYQPTGAIVAAPTCSLPENLGGPRNWDYRYAWVRDSAFTVYALMRLGFTEEAERFIEFMESLCTRSEAEGPLQVMYGIDGRRHLEEQTLEHLSGYRDSRPVRIGNGAYNQLQLDIYGELLDAIYLQDKYGAPIGYDLWLTISDIVDWVCDNWQRADDGIWEVRGGQQHFVYSRLMCWVALDRALRLADKRSFPGDWSRWREVRDTIYREIMDRGFDAGRNAFVQRYGATTLDAANLMMPLTFFVSPVDPRMLATLDAILAAPEDGGLTASGLVYRYNVGETLDGLAGEEGTFNICTFWLVEALTRAGRYRPERLEEARLLFERMLGFANHLGLYAEETGPKGEALGNFPQAFTHLALISAAFNLDRTLGGKD